MTVVDNRESREVVRHVPNREVVAQLVSGAHWEDVCPRLTCAMELRVKRLRSLSWSIWIEESSPDNFGARVHLQKLFMKARLGARVFRDGSDGVGLLDLAFLQPVFEACSGNDDSTKALLRKRAQELHVPWKFTLHVVNGSIVGESSPRQVHEDLGSSEPLESISRRCFEVKLREVLRPRRISPSGAKNFDDFVASVRD